jgi:Tol biopolymer transport system component
MVGDHSMRGHNYLASNRLFYIKYLVLVIASIALLYLIACQQSSNSNAQPVALPSVIELRQNCSFVSISPDDEWLACAQTTGEEAGLWVTRTNEGSWVQIVSYDEETVLQFTEWSPDGQTLALGSSRPPIWKYQIDDWHERALLYEGFGDYEEGWFWSPDGKYLTIGSRIGGLTLVQPDGSGSEILFKDGVIGRRPDYSGTEIGWSPDGTQIAYWTIPDVDWENRDLTAMQLWCINVETKETRFLYTPEKLRGFASKPLWSPNGNYIAFAVIDQEKENSPPLISLLDTEMRQGRFFELPKDLWVRVSDLTWSPDSKYIAMLSEPNQENTTDIWLLSIDSGKVRQVTLAGHYRQILKWTEQGIVALTHEHTIEVISVEN